MKAVSSQWSHETSRLASGYLCPVPVSYAFQGEMWRRDCGNCPRCVARKKRDTAGRAAAEAHEAAEVVVWTLTYRDGNPGALDFVTPDRQKFLKRIRDWLYRRARREVGAPKRIPKADLEQRAYWKARIAEVLTKVRYLGVGERGKRNTMRCHWHIVLMFSKPSGFRSTPREAPSGKYPKGRPGHEHHDLWPFGWVNIDVLPVEMSARMRALRYCCKYLDKTLVPKIDGLRRGDKSEAKFFRSSATPLGYDYLIKQAKYQARQALPCKGMYFVPGVVFSRPSMRPVRAKDGRVIGHRINDLVAHKVTGRMRDHFIKAYRDEWLAYHPHVDVPASAWMLQFDSEADLDLGLGRRVLSPGWKPRGKTMTPIPSERWDCAGTILLHKWGTGRVRVDLGLIDIHPDGEADWVDPEGTEWPIIGPGLRDLLPDLPNVQHEHIERQLAKHRGPDWLSRRERRQAVRDLAMARFDAISTWAKRGPNPNPAHLPPDEPVTAMYRRQRMYGRGYMPGVVVKHILDPIESEPHVRRDFEAVFRPIHKREA